MPRAEHCIQANRDGAGIAGPVAFLQRGHCRTAAVQGGEHAFYGCLIEVSPPARDAVRAAIGRSRTGVSLMNKDIIAGKWTQMKGSLKEKWGDLTDDDFDVAEGNAQYLAGKLQ